MLRSVLVIILVAFSASVSAQGVSYDYVQGSYGRVDLDGVGLDVDGNGLGIAASFEVADNFHIFGEYQTADLDFGVDLNLMELGFGYHTDMSPNLSLNANLGYVNIEADASGAPSSDEDGFSFGVGLRGAVSDAVELFGGLDYVDFDQSDSETRANAGLVVGLTDQLGVGAKVTLWDDVNIYQLNLRWYFQ